MASLPTGTVTVLFTDIEGSTVLLQQLKDAYPDVLMECRRLQAESVVLLEDRRGKVHTSRDVSDGPALPAVV